MIRLPYGISDYATLRRDGYFYQDRTGYFRVLEGLGERYLTFLRPRRFGKSLWLSTLGHYYGREHADDFDLLFGGLAAGKEPTPLAGKYLVLEFDFSRIETSSRSKTKEDFFENVKRGIGAFLHTYSTVLPQIDQAEIFAATDATQMINRLFGELDNLRQQPKVYLLIDEYDHFTNELISLDLRHFQDIVTGNGWVRKFYETIKQATGQGIVERIFMTGVSPITLDSLTSGFNVSANLSLDPRFGGLMGFTAAECIGILRRVGVSDEKLPVVMDDLQSWYNGYRFVPEGQAQAVYNPDMVLYFAKEYQHRQDYPQQMLDTNIASDYGKIRKLFRLGGKEMEHFQLLWQLFDTGELRSSITAEFSFEKSFTLIDFASLLYYMGLLTIKGQDLSESVLAIPNKVIEKLYYEYFAALVREQLDAPVDPIDVQGAVRQLARHNDPQPLLDLTATTLAQLSNRDWIQFSESSLKSIFVSYLHASQLYLIHSEPEYDQKYVDLLLLRRQPFPAPYQFAFELKYLKQKDAHRLDAVIAEATAQLRGYLQSETLGKLPDLRAWLLVFVGTEVGFAGEVR